MESKPQIISLENGDYIAYHMFEGSSPCIIFLGGFMSDMTGSKAIELESYCKERGQAFIRFDYYAHGESSGDFRNYSVKKGYESAEIILEKLGHSKNILVGSSMGGWIMLALSLKHRDKISALVGIAAAPDFTEELIKYKLPDAIKKQIEETGEYLQYSPYWQKHYPITKILLEESKEVKVLNHEKLTIDIPIRLLHGMEDSDVPYDFSLRIANKVTSRDVQIIFIKDGDHRLSRDEDIKLLKRTISELV